MEEKNFMLTQIANHLIINASFLEELGLYYGKMGAVLFFVHYARYVNNEIYDDFAGELLDEIYEEIHDKISVDFEYGLAGIGWGLIYLLNNKYVEGNPNEVLKCIDSKILSLGLENKNRSVDSLGISFYVQERILLGNYDDELCRFICNYDGQRKNIDSLVSWDHNEVVNIYDLNLGLYKGIAGLGIKLML